MARKPPASFMARIEEAEKVRDEAKVNYDVAQASFTALRAAARCMCDHSNGYETSCMGDKGFKCPDCGYSR